MNGAECGACGYIQCRCADIKRKEEEQWKNKHYGLQAKNKLLWEALEKYGEHEGICYKSLNKADDCSCGLDKALKGGQ